MSRAHTNPAGMSGRSYTTSETNFHFSLFINFISRGSCTANQISLKSHLNSEAKRMWSTQVQVAPAAYHIKFLVDGVWKTSDALPLATDSGGRLVNYIDVRTKGPEIKEWGKDWWGVGTEDEEDQGKSFSAPATQSCVLLC
jgi:hypothetical protein